LFWNRQLFKKKKANENVTFFPQYLFSIGNLQMSSRTALPQCRSHPMQSMKVASCLWHELLLVAGYRLPELE